MNLDTNQWKEFKVSAIFTIHNGKGITKEEIEENEGDFTVVQSGEENNGVLGKISHEYCETMGYTFCDEPCLTVARSGSAGFVSFQVNGCVVGDSAKILLLDRSIASVELYLFLQALLSANRFKYAYGRKVTESKYMNDILKLPIMLNSDGSALIDETKKYSVEGYIPNWNLMENYIKLLHHLPLRTNNKSPREQIDTGKWKEFSLNKLFNISIAKSADIGNLEEGKTPFVGRTNTNNGIQGFVEPVCITEGRCITISMVGTNVALYQENEFQASQNIAVLRNNELNKHRAMFICSMINFEMKLKYSYGRTVGKSNIEEMVLPLPIKYNYDGNPIIDNTCKYSKNGYIPDWDWMEMYIKSLPYGDRL